MSEDASKLTVDDLCKQIDAVGARALGLIDKIQKERDKYRDALREVYDHAVDEYDGPEDHTHSTYLQIAGGALGLIP